MISSKSEIRILLL